MVHDRVLFNPLAQARQWGLYEIAAPAPSYEAALRRPHLKNQKCTPTRLPPWVHSRSLRSPGRLARRVFKPRAVSRLRTVDYGDIARELDAS